MSLLVRKTILQGPSRPMVLELPSFKMPSLKTAFLLTVERGLVFMKQAGTVIITISVILWWLSAFPTVSHTDQAAALEHAASNSSLIDSDQAEQLRADAARLKTFAEQDEDAEPPALSETGQLVAKQYAVSQSVVGSVGKFIEPAIVPLGYDWQIGIGLLSSFAAREVFVSTMAVVFATDDSTDQSLVDRIRKAKRKDGKPIFSQATSISLLVFYVLALQCFPTLVVTARETGHWKWSVFQLLSMSAIAYIAALITYQSLTMFGVS